MTEFASIAAAEVGCRRKPASDGDIQNRLCSLQQHRSRTVEAQLQIVVARTRTQVPGKQALELSRRQADLGGNLLHGSRFVMAGLHDADRRDEPRVGNAEATLHCHPLRILRAPDARVDELLDSYAGRFMADFYAFEPAPERPSS